MLAQEEDDAGAIRGYAAAADAQQSRRIVFLQPFAVCMSHKKLCFYA